MEHERIKLYERVLGIWTQMQMLLCSISDYFVNAFVNAAGLLT